MRFLFYFIHPAKCHAFRITINELLNRGHRVDVAIISKDIVEDLVKSEGWDYHNLFPEGRRIPNLHTYLNAAVNSFRTLYRLLKYTRGKKYDLIITDDLVTLTARLKRTPVIFFTDDDLKAVPESVVLIATANYVLCPSVSYMGFFKYKKIGYPGLKSLAHLHPNSFTPDVAKLSPELQSLAKKYFLIRCVSATSTHDVGKRGLVDDLLVSIVNLLSEHGKVIINSQRDLPEALQKYVYPIDKMNMSHYIYYSRLFISDSTTMCAEAAVLGTPAVEIDDWYADFEQYKILSDKYGLLKGFFPGNDREIIGYLNELLNNQNLDSEFQMKRENFLKDHIDLSKFMIWLFENYPDSVKVVKENPDCFEDFK